MRASLAVLALSLAVAACAPRAADEVADGEPRHVETEAEFEAALDRLGLQLRPEFPGVRASADVADRRPGVTANRYWVGGAGRGEQGAVLVYTFGSAEAAERNALHVAEGRHGYSGSGFQPYHTSPRVYRNGPLVVAHFGTVALDALLRRLLGPPVT